MNDYQKQQYQIRYKIDNYICYVTGKIATQIAHRIANNKTNRKKYGEYINHNINLVPVLNLEINDKMNIGMNEKKCKKLIDYIKENYNKKIKAKTITEYIENE